MSSSDEDNERTPESCYFVSRNLWITEESVFKRFDIELSF